MYKQFLKPKLTMRESIVRVLELNIDLKEVPQNVEKGESEDSEVENEDMGVASKSVAHTSTIESRMSLRR